VAAIETEELSKDFLVGFWRPRPYRALDSLTLSVDEGEVFGFLGPNGAGKSTTLKLLMQLLYPTSGTARILGRPVGDRSVKQRIGFLPENPYFYDHLTAEELLSYFARAVRPARAGCGASRVGGARRSGHRVRAAAAPAPVLEGDDPAGGSGAGPAERARGRLPRRAHVGPRSAGPPRRAPDHAAPARSWLHGVLLVAHPVGRGGPLQPRGHPRPGTAGRAGRLSEILAFELRGWELVVANLSDELRATIAPRVRGIVAVAHGRFTIDLPAEESPDRFILELGRGGAQIISLNPLRETLEDYFVQSVGAAESRGRDRVVAMRAIALVAQAVFKESVRDRVPYSMVAFAVLVIAASYLISQLTAGQDMKIIKDLGLAAISSSASSSRSSSASASSRRRWSAAASSRCSPSR
jgi:ABC-2 type transport system ATP-binding protein